MNTKLIGIVISRNLLSDDKKTKVEDILSLGEIKRLHTVITFIGQNEVHMFICSAPADMDGLACNEYTCLDGWYFDLDNKFQIKGHMQ